MSEDEWIATDENNICVLPYSAEKIEISALNRFHLQQISSDDQEFAYVEELKINEPVIYLAVDGKEKLEYEMKAQGKVNVEIEIDDPAVASLDDNGIISAHKAGNTKLRISAQDLSVEQDIVVTNLLVVMPKEFDTSKPFLPCGVISEEENDLLDQILEARVKKAGYGTRAGAVAAARFLGLEFPYRINYFMENGRMSDCRVHKVDGEGRYYHKGLYLHESRIANIAEENRMGVPAPWGCPIYEYTFDRYTANGLDCSGSISWVLLQGGFDPGDVGAGLVNDCISLGDLAERKLLSEALANRTLRVGDLLSGGDGYVSPYGGHIALVAGIDDDYNIFVAEELGYSWGWGYYITKYTAETILHHFYWQVDMDAYYVEDGLLTDYWIE